jgi:pyrroline-5-carboxylate reductase
MRVVIVGAGNVATVLGRLIRDNGHTIVQVVSRAADNAAILANELNCAFTDNSGVIDQSADLYLIAVTDTAMSQLDERYHLGDKLVAHTAGSVSKDALKNITNNYGVVSVTKPAQAEYGIATRYSFAYRWQYGCCFTNHPSVCCHHIFKCNDCG